MFSIDMGILYTLNLNTIVNDKIYDKVKQHIIEIRNSYLIYFVVISFFIKANDNK